MIPPATKRINHITIVTRVQNKARRCVLHTIRRFPKRGNQRPKCRRHSIYPPKPPFRSAAHVIPCGTHYTPKTSNTTTGVMPKCCGGRKHAETTFLQTLCRQGGWQLHWPRVRTKHYVDTITAMRALSCNARIVWCAPTRSWMALPILPEAYPKENRSPMPSTHAK